MVISTYTYMVMHPRYYKPKFTKESILQRWLICSGYHLPFNPNNREYAKRLRKNMTLHEKILRFNFLRNLDCRVTKQRCIDHYIVDFYIASKNLVIEVDGDSHNKKKALLYDEQRTTMLEIYNLRVLRVNNNDIIDDFEWVCKKIMDAL